MGLFSRKQQSNIDLRSIGTWTWYGAANQWSLDFNNRLGQLLGVKLDDFVQSLKELKGGQDFPNVPTDGKRIDISGMYGIGNDYRWYAYVHGEDGRHYFVKKFDAVLAQLRGSDPPVRQADEIDLIPFEAEGQIPSATTHPVAALVSDPDEVGASRKPTISIADENVAAVFAKHVDYTDWGYGQLASFLLGGAIPWQEGVLNELKRRHAAGILDVTALDKAVEEYKVKEAEHKTAVEKAALNVIEARLRKAMAYDFDPPGGWGVLGIE